MTAKVTDCATAVLNSLNATTFSQSFTAIRSYFPTFANLDFETRRVVVRSAAAVTERYARGKDLETVKIEIWMAFRPTTRDLTAGDREILVANEIVNHFLGIQLSTANAFCRKVEQEPLYDREEVGENDFLFTTLITLTLESMA